MISEIGVSAHGEALLLTRDDGLQSKIDAASLRRSAMDALTRRERLQTGTVHVSDGIRITQLTAMGSTGFNIQFSDGHDKAIFPVRYLEKLVLDSDK